MNIKELIENNYDAIVEAIEEAQERAYRNPDFECRVMLTEDGKVELDDEFQCGSNWGYADDHRYHIWTADSQCFDILWDHWIVGDENVTAVLENHFNIAIAPEDLPDGDEEEQIREVAKSHGFSEEEIDKALEEELDAAISESVSEIDYQRIIDIAIEKWERFFEED